MILPYETVREKVIQANPGLLREIEDSAHALGALQALEVSTRPIEGHDDPGSITDCFNIVREGIIDRPIRLADVLIAIGAFNEESRRVGWLAKREKVISSWNLRKDDLSLQSEETINFLAHILK